MDVPVRPDVPQEPLTFAGRQSRPKSRRHAANEGDRFAPVAAPAARCRGKSAVPDETAGGWKPRQRAATAARQTRRVNCEMRSVAEAPGRAVRWHTSAPAPCPVCTVEATMSAMVSPVPTSNTVSSRELAAESDQGSSTSCSPSRIASVPGSAAGGGLTQGQHHFGGRHFMAIFKTQNECMAGTPDLQRSHGAAHLARG